MTFFTKKSQRCLIPTEILWNIIDIIKIQIKTNNIEEIIALIDSHSDIFNYAYLETIVNYDHALETIWKYHGDINFHILLNYRLPLNYALNKLADNIITDEQTVIILEKYRVIYNDVKIYDMFFSKEEGRPLLNIFFDDEKDQSLKYLLDNEVIFWSDEDHECGTLYDLYPEEFINDAETNPRIIKCNKLLYDKISAHVFKNSLRGTWIKAITL